MGLVLQLRRNYNYKSDSTPIGTPDSKFEGTLNETSNHVNLKPSEVNSKSEGTPISTPSSTRGTPM